jgi:hypothetical protein
MVNPWSLLLSFYQQITAIGDAHGTANPKQLIRPNRIASPQNCHPELSLERFLRQTESKDLHFLH